MEQINKKIKREKIYELEINKLIRIKNKKWMGL